MALEPPETGRCDATARARDVTNRIDTFPGPATVAEFLCFYFFFSPLFHLSIPKKILDRDRPGISPALPGWRRRNTSAERARQRHFARIANHLELGNRKRTILSSQNPSFHLSSPNPTAVNGPAVPRRKPSFYVFVLLSFSDTLSSSTPTRTNECTVRAYTHYRRKDWDQSPWLLVPGTGRVIGIEWKRTLGRDPSRLTLA